MANDPGTDEGPLFLGLIERGDPTFVDAIRKVDDADALADFAGRWYDDPRPTSRRLLLAYLERPLNAYRHEGLIKRLFKRAEAAGDDPAMARFLALFDRSIRRVRRQRTRYEHRYAGSAEEARALAATWVERGYSSVSTYEFRGQYGVRGHRRDEVALLPTGTAMPRDRSVAPPGRGPVPDRMGSRLFSPATRHYLRRRAWRYFRSLGRSDPARYVAAASEALALYGDEDVGDGLALLDNWGLVHILFHHSPALVARPSGWITAPGRSLSELAPAPIFGSGWAGAPGAVVDLLARARCRPVRRWAIRRIEADPAARAACSLKGWVALLGHEDPEVVGLAAEILRAAEGLDALGTDRWLSLVESTAPAGLDVVCELAGRHVGPDQVTLEQAARLAGLRPLPVARLGLSWLRAKDPREARPVPALLGLLDAGCVPLRPEILRWLRDSLETSRETVLAFLDSRHADARAEGWDWLRTGTIPPDDVETWRRLLESPHDDVRLPLVAELESRAGLGDADPIGRALGADDFRRLWASVLLNIHRGSRSRSPVVRQILRRLEARPDDAPALLPLLGVALRSVRGPERREGLVAVVRLVDRRAELAPMVRSAFPELQWA